MLVSEGYTAPELGKAGIRTTYESDVYALGKSVLEVLGAMSWQAEREEWFALRKIALGMVCEEPHQRTSVLQAEHAICMLSLDAPSTSLRGMIVMDCDEICYSQQECSPHFTDGRTFRELIDQLIKDPSYACAQDDLVINVVRRPDGRTHSTDNRRLYCFHEALKTLRQTRTGNSLHVRVRLTKLTDDVDRFLQHYDTRNGGRSIYVGHNGLPTG